MFILKLTLVPIIIGLIAIIGRYQGAKIAGLLSGLPIIGGPIIYFLYVEQGAAFADAATIATVGGVVALSSFCFSYAWLTTRFNWFWSLLIAFCVYFALAFVFVYLNLTLLTYFLISLATLLAQIYFSPKHQESVNLTAASNVEIMTRMLCAAALVMFVTYFARLLGSAYSGVLTAFPIAATVIAVFSYKNHSKFHAMDALRSLKFGLLSLLFFFFTLSLLIPIIGFNGAFILSIVAALLVQLGIWIFKKVAILKPLQV
jgi:hypothetical protein